MEAIKLIDLKKVYQDVVAVDSINLTINEGELFGLLGVNGAGKTTTIKMLSCLTEPTSGEAYIYGNNILHDSKKIKELMSVSLQETAIARNLTVKENLEFIAAIYGMKDEELKKAVDKTVEDFNLSSILDKKAKKLSGGWQRRLSIALALITSPKVLFLDEPTLGLDVLARRELWKIIENLKGKITIILTTHYLEEAEALCDRIAIMVDGRIKDIDTAKNLIEKTGSKNIEDAFVKIASKEAEV